MSKKYICYSGWVKSRSDGDMHFITASRVAQLYNVNPEECIFIDTPADYEIKTRVYTKEALANRIPLAPRDDGHYTL